MAPPPIQLFLTTIASQPKLRQRQEYILRILQVKKIPYKSYDLASDEVAKRLWRRKAPAGKQDIPGILIGNKWPGPFEAFEEAVEYGELDIFLRRNEEWDPELEDRIHAGNEAVGVPGAYTPNQMTGQTASHAPEGTEVKRGVRDGEIDLGDVLSGYGLQGVKVTADDITEFMKNMGLDDALSAPAPAPSETIASSATSLSVSRPPAPITPSTSSSSTKPLTASPAIIIPSDSSPGLADAAEEPSETTSATESDESESHIPRPLNIRKRTDERPLKSPGDALSPPLLPRMPTPTSPRSSRIASVGSPLPSPSSTKKTETSRIVSSPGLVGGLKAVKETDDTSGAEVGQTKVVPDDAPVAPPKE